MKIGVYRTYNFIDKAPTIDACHTILKDEGLNYNQAGRISGVSPGTLANWIDGETKNPKDATLTALTSSLGYVRRDTLDKNGNVHIGYVKARDVDDWQAEIKKATNWLLRQNRRPKKRKSRAKKNGNGHANGHAVNGHAR